VYATYCPSDLPSPITRIGYSSFFSPQFVTLEALYLLDLTLYYRVSSEYILTLINSVGSRHSWRYYILLPVSISTLYDANRILFLLIISVLADRLFLLNGLHRYCRIFDIDYSIKSQLRLRFDFRLRTNLLQRAIQILLQQIQYQYLQSEQ